MFISEAAFPHLMAAREERLAEALERRRVVLERLAEASTAAASSVSSATAARRGTRAAPVREEPGAGELRHAM